MLARFTHLLLAMLVLSSAVSASLSDDEQLKAFFARESAAVEPVNFGRRSAATTPTRHLRPDVSGEDVTLRKRDSITPPDVGQVADWGGSNPQPVRNGAGDTFLANSNHQIDAQNPDNVAAPPTDSGQ